MPLFSILALCAIVLLSALCILALRDRRINLARRRHLQRWLPKLRNPSPIVAGIHLPESVLDFYRTSPIVEKADLFTQGADGISLYVSRFLPINDESIRQLKSGEKSIAFAEDETGKEYLFRENEGVQSMWICHSADEVYMVSSSVADFFGLLGHELPED